MINKKKKTGMYILMALITVLVVFPFIWMLVLSFKSNSEILSTPLSLPKSINFDNYKHAMDVLDFPKLYGNTIFVCVISLVIELVITFFSSFAISRMEFKNEKIALWLFDYGVVNFSVYSLVPGVQDQCIFRVERQDGIDIALCSNVYFI